MNTFQNIVQHLHQYTSISGKPTQVMHFIQEKDIVSSLRAANLLFGHVKSSQ